jgi:hypothetical protein
MGWSGGRRGSVTATRRPRRFVAHCCLSYAAKWQGKHRKKLVEPRCCERDAVGQEQCPLNYLHVWPRLDDGDSPFVLDVPMPQTTHIIYRLGEFLCVHVDHCTNPVIRFRVPIRLVVIFVVLLKVLLLLRSLGRVDSANVALWYSAAADAVVAGHYSLCGVAQADGLRLPV